MIRLHNAQYFVERTPWKRPIPDVQLALAHTYLSDHTISARPVLADPPPIRTSSGSSQYRSKTVRRASSVQSTKLKLDDETLGHMRSCT